jgi:superfamily II DNA/RNA helicase
MSELEQKYLFDGGEPIRVPKGRFVRHMGAQPPQQPDTESKIEQRDLPFQEALGPAERRPDLFEGDFTILDLDGPCYEPQGAALPKDFKRCDSLEEFAAKYSAPLRIAKTHGEKGLRYVTPQMEAAEYLAATTGDVMVEAPTGSGKTAIASMLIGVTARPENKIIVVAPTKILCGQWVTRVDSFLDLSRLNFDCPVTALSSDRQTVPADKRLKVFLRPGAEIIIVTPESLLIDLAKIPPKILREKIGLIVFDEADEARENDAMNLASDKIKEIGTRQVYFSAAYEDRLDAVIKMARQKGASYFPVKVAPQLFAKSVNFRGLATFEDQHNSNLIINAQKRLFEGLNQEAQIILDGLPTGTSRLALKIEDVIKKANDSGMWPSHKVWSALLEQISAACRQTEGRWSSSKAAALSSAYTISHMEYLHQALVKCGASQFMSFVAENIAATKFGLHNLKSDKSSDPDARYMRRLYAPERVLQSPVLAAFVEVAKYNWRVGEPLIFEGENRPTAFLKWATAGHLEGIAKVLYKDEQLQDMLQKLSDLESVRSATIKMIDDCLEEFSDRCGTLHNHPKEEALLKDIADYFTYRGPDGRALIYTFYADHAFYLEKVINKSQANLGIKAAAITGSSHQASKVRDAQLRKFLDGEAQVLIFTDVAKKGIDTPAEHLFVYSPPSKGRDMVQLVGRIRNHELGIPMYRDPKTGTVIPKAKVHFYIGQGNGENWAYKTALKGFKDVQQRVVKRRDEPEDHPF